MREILFRGQTRKFGEKVNMAGEKLPGNWVYGGIFQGTGNFSIIYGWLPDADHNGSNIDKHVVYTDTVGQYTGLTDKNGTKIFEGDILKYPDYSGGTRLFAEQPKMVDVVKWNEKTASFTVGGNRLFYLVDTQKCEVIGNIHDKGGVIDE